MPELEGASLWDLGFCEGEMLGSWNLARSEAPDSVVLALAPEMCQCEVMMPVTEQWRTFFCSRTTLVHFFSSRPSYFFRVVSSKLAGTFASSRKAAAALLAPMTAKYATIALLLDIVSADSERQSGNGSSYSSSACRSVSIALMVKSCNHARAPRAATMHVCL